MSTSTRGRAFVAAELTIVEHAIDGLASGTLKSHGALWGAARLLDDPNRWPSVLDLEDDLCGEGDYSYMSLDDRLERLLVVRDHLQRELQIFIDSSR